VTLLAKGAHLPAGAALLLELPALVHGYSMPEQAQPVPGKCRFHPFRLIAW